MHGKLLIYRFLNDPQRAEVAGRQALEISEQHGFSFCRDFARTFIGWARAQLGSAGEGAALIQQGLAGLAEKGARVMITDNLTRLAEAQALDGKIDEALVTIEDALQANPEETVFIPNILRCRGELRLKIGETELAEADFREAITLARKMSAKMFELQASISLARLLESRGRRAEARAMLGEMFSWFTEGFDTRDLIDAMALLNELST
jgi:hypothetical protein